VVGRGPIVLGTSLTALGWNFLFCPPRYSFHIAAFYDKMMLVTYFAVALTIGQLTARLRAERRLENQREKCSAALYHLAREFAEPPEVREFLSRAAGKASAVFNAKILFLLPAPGGMRLVELDGSEGEWFQKEVERNASLWAFQNNQPAGRGTSSPLGAANLYL